MTIADTIFALSTAAGRAGVAVVRLSGPRAGPALQKLTGWAAPPKPRQAALARFLDGAGQPIDRGLCLWFPGPGSFTGEDLVEFQVHGSRAVVAALLETLAQQPGLRPAEAGEFTRQAFDNHKLDLSEVEGLADLIEAETEAQRRQALRQLEGDLSRLVENWRARLTLALAQLEATIDFPDEEIPDGLDQETLAGLAHLAEEMAGHLSTDNRAERLREGYRIAIIGPTNAGKSSLLNALARRDVAIVSALAGTTRDVIEVHLDLAGYPVIVADTAGLRALEIDDLAAGAVDLEQEGMRRSRMRAADADLKLAVFDIRSWPDLDLETAQLIDENTLILLNKTDLASERKDTESPDSQEIVALSAKTGAGLQDLLRRLEARVEMDLGLSDSSPPILTRLRHRQALEACHEALTRSLAAPQVELAAEDLRLAVRALGRITGRVDVEDLLDLIFGEFCIGK